MSGALAAVALLLTLGAPHPAHGVSGTVLARSITNGDLSGIAQGLNDNPLLVGDFYTTNYRDPGMRLLLPGSGTVEKYFVRVRSNPQPDNPITDLDGGLSSGAYQMQIRLRQVGFQQIGA